MNRNRSLWDGVEYIQDMRLQRAWENTSGIKETKLFLMTKKKGDLTGKKSRELHYMPDLYWK